MSTLVLVIAILALIACVAVLGVVVFLLHLERKSHR